MNSIAEGLIEVRKQIAIACENSQREQNSVQLLAVSKTKPATAVQAAYQQGQRKFGENYVQELVTKAQQLADLKDIEWHFIGPIQSNKTKDIAKTAAWVHSVDRAKIIRRLAEQRPSGLPPLNVLIQVNIDDEETKSGVAPSQIAELAALVDDYPQLRLRGLMTIPRANSDEAHQRQSFEHMANLYSELSSQYPEVDTLSMGMSGDLELAIACGSTLVRVGTAIFGART